MCQTVQISLDDLDGHLIVPPIIDSLRYEPALQAFAATFVPHDLVSSDEKAMVTIPERSPEGERIRDGLLALGRAIGETRAVEMVVHDGGAHFTFGLASGGSMRLSDERLDLTVTLAAIDVLRDLGNTAQIVFLKENRAAA